MVLYALAEVQTGTAGTIRVTAQGGEFSVSDNGRGHSIDKVVEGTSYLTFIYSHFDYPFDAARNAPVQLQGIGMSLINSLCSELNVTVNKPDAKLELQFRFGVLHTSHRDTTPSGETGITIAGQISAHLQGTDVAIDELDGWLQGVLAVTPSLTLYFNDRRL